MKLKSIIAFALVFITITSCITIEETYTFNADGSGVMNYLIDFTEFGEMIDSMSDSEDEVEEATETEEEQDPIEEMRVAFKEKLAEIESIDGISEAQLIDKGTFIVSIQYKFRDIAALNKALNSLKNEEASTEHEFFVKKGKKLVHTTTLSDIEKSLFSEDESAEDREMMEMFTDQMHYKIAINFASPVKSIKTTGPGSLDASQKSFIVETTFKDLLENQTILNGEFKMK